MIEVLKGDTVLAMFAAPGAAFLQAFANADWRTACGFNHCKRKPEQSAAHSLVKRDTLKANRVFYRYSALNPDKRVDPVHWEFPAGHLRRAGIGDSRRANRVPGGRAICAANVLPASFRYEITAPVGTVVDFGFWNRCTRLRAGG